MRGIIRSFSNSYPSSYSAAESFGPLKKVQLMFEKRLQQAHEKQSNTHPVSSSRRCVLKLIKVCHRWLWKFLMCCASSRTRSRHRERKCTRVSHRFNDKTLIQKAQTQELTIPALALESKWVLHYQLIWCNDNMMPIGLGPSLSELFSPFRRAIVTQHL